MLIFFAGFYAGKRYGANVEAQTIAFVLKAEALAAEDYKSVVQKIKAGESYLLARLKSFL